MKWAAWLTLASAVGSGLIAGVFFAFSNFVMGALGKLPPAHGAAAMQSINVVVLNGLFLSILMCTALGGLALAGLGAMRLGQPAGWLLMAGGLSYALGCVGVTMAFNVPLNDALKAVDPAGADGAALWARYLKDWTWWNGVRTLFAAAGMVLLVFAWRELTRGR